MKHGWSVVAAIAIAVGLIGVGVAGAQPRLLRGATAWKRVDRVPAEVEQAPRGARPGKFAAFAFERKVMELTLARAPMEDTPAAAHPIDVPVPMPDGTVAVFRTVEAPVMHPDLQARYPQIRTYLGYKSDDRATTARMDLTPLGFHAQIITPGGAVYVDPYTRNDAMGYYASYWVKDCPSTDWHCGADELPRPDPEPAMTDATGPTRRVYRLAVAGTGEFTADYGGTVAGGLSAITTAVNRTTGLYEVEFNIRFQLVANNDLLVYLDGATDPYTNSNSGTMLGENQTNLDLVIGNANYDIGHAFGTAGGGVSNLGVVGNNASKARGVSANFPPFAESPSTTITVAHEIGHMFNAGHSWNSPNGSCTAGQWGGSAQAFESGSGNTVMSYAGACSPDNYSPASRDFYFSSGSYDRITAWANGGSGVFVSEATGNSAPTVNAGVDRVIPARTPFLLTAVGSDPDGDAITYCWEQRNGSTQFALSAGDPGTGPIIRSFPAVSAATRTVPRLSNLLSNSTTPGEILPTTSRTLTMRCTVRDNRAGMGGTNFDDMTITVVNTGTPFKVTFPNLGAGTLSGFQNITWDVAGTTGSGINTANVRILLSTDGGNTWPTTLAASTPNDGAEVVQLPQITTSSARIRVEAVGNIYFDVSDGNFSITPAPATAYFNLGGAVAIADTLPNGNSNGAAEPGENSIVLTVPVKNIGLVGATGLSSTLSSLSATASVVTGVSAYADLPVTATGNNVSGFKISVGPNHPCGQPVNLRLSVASGQGSNSFDFSIPTGTAGAPVGPTTFTYSGAAVAIPENNTSGVLVPLVVSSLTGAITDINFRFNGATCSTSATSTTVGLNHSAVGDLIVTLISPRGTSAVLMNQMPNGAGSSTSNNFCQTLLDDQGGGPSIQAQATGSPFTGTWTPATPLAVFNGEDPNGTWNLWVQDVAANDTGSVRTFSLIIMNQGAVCSPPVSIPPCSPADIATEGSAYLLAGPDGFVTGIDFDVFITAYFTSLRRADNSLVSDITDGSGQGGPDGFLTGTDFDLFVELYFLGCP